MPSWRCPHCSTPQPEASRCWVCHRSSTSCGTCRHFRRSVAARTGYCALDRRHEPLNGDEVRGCWEDGAAPVAPEPAIPGLLGLLTTDSLASPASIADEPPAAARPSVDQDRAPQRPMTGPLRLRPATTVPIRRDWVEVDA